MLSALLLLLGFFAGMLAAMTGIGGGVLLAPILALQFGIPIRQAIGTSLVAVITTSAACSSVPLQRHTTDIRLGMALELRTSLGAAVTAYLVGYCNRNLAGRIVRRLSFIQFDHDSGARRQSEERRNARCEQWRQRDPALRVSGCRRTLWLARHRRKARSKCQSSSFS